MPRDIVEKIIVCLCAVALWAWILGGHKCHSDAEGEVSCEDTICCQHTVCEQQETPACSSPVAHRQEKPTPQPQHKPQRRVVCYNGRYFSYSRAFSDRNDLHLEAAHRIGLSHGPANREAAAKMQDQLREIHTNRYYVVEELTHSVPYLVPTAAARLDSIGKEFADILQRNGLPNYRFRVTSVLRSQADIQRLQRCNHNSISNSAHNYGTTFDIGYWHYDQPVMTTDSMTDDNLKLVLAQTLLNQQRAGHIYVKYEYKQSCFHVTARD